MKGERRAGSGSGPRRPGRCRPHARPRGIRTRWRSAEWNGTETMASTGPGKSPRELREQHRFEERALVDALPARRGLPAGRYAPVQPFRGEGEAVRGAGVPPRPGGSPPAAHPTSISSSSAATDCSKDVSAASSVPSSKSGSVAPAAAFGSRYELRDGKRSKRAAHASRPPRAGELPEARTRPGRCRRLHCQPPLPPRPEPHPPRRQRFAVARVRHGPGRRLAGYGAPLPRGGAPRTRVPRGRLRPAPLAGLQTRLRHPRDPSATRKTAAPRRARRSAQSRPS